MQVLLSDYEFVHALKERLRDTLRTEKSLHHLMNKAASVNLFAPLTVYTPNLIQSGSVDLTPLDLAVACLDSDDLCEFLDKVSLPRADQTVLSGLTTLVTQKINHISQTGHDNFEKRLCDVCSDLRSVCMGVPDSVMFVPDILSTVLVRRNYGQAFVTPRLKNILLQKDVKANKNNREILTRTYLLSSGSELNFVKNYLDFCDKSWLLDADNQKHVKKVIENVSRSEKEEVKAFFDKKCLLEGLGETDDTKQSPPRPAPKM